MDEEKSIIPDQDFFSQLQGYQPEIVKDEDEFKPIKGKYIAEIKSLTHNIGIGFNSGQPFDFYSLQLQVTETVEGDKGDRRYFKKNFNNTIEGVKKIIDVLHTSGIPYETSSKEAFDLSLPATVGHPVKINAWAWTPEKTVHGDVIPEEERKPIQQFKVVNEFKKGKAKKEKSDDSNVPF